MTLLEKAKAAKSGTKKRLAIDREVLDLSIAWLRGEVSAAQAAEALGKSRPNMDRAMMAVIRTAISAGMITVEYRNE